MHVKRYSRPGTNIVVIKFIEGFIKKDFRLFYFYFLFFFCLKIIKINIWWISFLGYLKGLSKWDIKVMKERDDGKKFYHL